MGRPLQGHMPRQPPSAPSRPAVSWWARGHERLREQCVGASAGARVWYDEQEDELYWPLLLLYPEAAQSDMVQVQMNE